MMILTRRHPDLDDSLFQRLKQEHEKSYASGIQINHKGHQGVSECNIDATPYMIKCYRTKSLLATLRLMLGRSRIDTSFRSAQALDAHGLAAAKHLMVVKHLSLFKSRAFLIMEKAPGTTLFEFIQAGTQLRLSDAAVENIAALVTGLHKLGIAHGDLHTRNLIIAEDGSVRLIDFDNARKSRNGIHKDLKRFRNAVAATSSYEPAITKAIKRFGHPYLND